jgi:hypothetical protein
MKTKEQKIAELEAKLEELRYKPLFKIDDVAILNENKLKVRIMSCNEKDRSYRVRYPNMPPDCWFYVKETELTLLPMNYDEVIYKAYIQLLVEKDKTLDYLRKGRK